MIIDNSKLDIYLAEHQFLLRDIGEKANISRTTLSKIRSGRPVRPATVGKLAEALKVPITDLLRS